MSGMEKKILVAGIGNIFLGDDAFGVEAVGWLKERPLPEGVRIVDFGIRSYDLAFALTEGYDAVILVDAVPRGGPPGTTYLMELDAGDLSELKSETIDGHSLNPVSVLQLAQALGGAIGKLFLVGCEPALLETEDGPLKLSPAVQAAVPQALTMIEELISELLGSKQKTNADPVPA